MVSPLALLRVETVAFWLWSCLDIYFKLGCCDLVFLIDWPNGWHTIASIIPAPPPAIRCKLADLLKIRFRPHNTHQVCRRRCRRHPFLAISLRWWHYWLVETGGGCWSRGIDSINELSNRMAGCLISHINEAKGGEDGIRVPRLGRA